MRLDYDTILRGLSPVLRGPQVKGLSPVCKGTLVSGCMFRSTEPLGVVPKRVCLSVRFCVLIIVLDDRVFLQTGELCPDVVYLKQHTALFGLLFFVVHYLLIFYLLSND